MYLFKFFLQVSVTKIPLDFLLDKANLTAFELETRFKLYGDIFNKDALKAGNQEAAAVPALVLLQEYKQRNAALWIMALDLADPRLKEIFRIRARKVFGKKYPHCDSLEQYLMEYKTGIYNNDKRQMVNVLCNQMWSKECMAFIEKMVMDRLGLEYENILIASGQKKVPKTRRTSGSFKGMFGRQRQTNFVDRFR